MDEPTTHDDDTDHVVAQLRRYADAAERTVPPIPTIDTTNARRRSLRPWLPAAAVVALLGGALATYAVTRGDDAALQTVDEPPTETSIDLEDACPAPRADGPRVEDLLMLSPMLGRSDSDTVSDADGSTTAIWIRLAEGSEVRSMVWGAPTTPDTLDGGEPTTVEICDPFSGSATRTEVPAAWHRDEDDRLRLEVVLTGGPGLHWSVTATTALSGSATDDELTSARAELRRLVAGMLWPAPVEELRRNDTCANEPVATIAAHQLLAVPEGYTTGEPEEVDTGAVDMGGEQWTRLPLLGPDGAQIDVISISTARFPEALANSAVGSTGPGSRTIQRCRSTAVADGEDAPAGTPEVTETRWAPDRLVIGAQEWEYGGWMVIGTGGATEEDVIDTAEALRS